MADKGQAPRAQIDSPEARFLDPSLFHADDVEPYAPTRSIDMPQSIIDIAGGVVDLHNISKSYFETIHTWMPIISKKEIRKHLLNLNYKKGDVLLLALSLKLCTAPTSTPRTTLYRTVKQLHFDLESSGLLSLHVLQAAILISLYEIGHAVYPAAYLSVGGCARYAAALGINKSAAAPDTAQTPNADVELQRRVWWAILILDRLAWI